MSEEVLVGGVANAGGVVRVGDEVRRPTNAHTESIHAFLSALVADGFDGASVPLGIEDRGRERLTFIEGDVAVPLYPRWAQTNGALQLPGLVDGSLSCRVRSCRIGGGNVER